MKSLTTVRKKSPNYPVEFKIKMVELSHRPDIRVFAFASEDKEYQPLLDDILDGPMVGRFDTEEAGKALIDGGLIERLMSTIMPFITSEAPLPDTHLRRETTWYYPLEAIRETVVNALAHRDWTRFVEIEIGLYREGANKQVISSQADSLIKISRIWADFFPANTSNQPI
ncbi:MULTISPECIES: hypothetical protein [unclassified Citrobacter freundii complex]|uniref:hypothetical protein n=1 Tax=unclassified Citrobacter freundii complex TaxID=2816438 RepID=UPI0015E1B2D1|nr:MULTISPECIES: hypothetical protein [unclassified Citrobacter freundii complex]